MEQPSRLSFRCVKDADTLYDKISEDRLDPSRAFEPQYVADLLGAHCLPQPQGRQTTRACIQTTQDQCERPTGPKNWLDEPHRESGYRGWRIDVEWTTPTEHGFDSAEIQIRTLLQGAWASFMHDDVYKTKARLMLTHETHTRFVEFSHLLYSADRIAEGLRNTVEAARVSDVSTIKRVETLNKAMFFMVNFLAQSHQTTRFTVISRCDEYVVDRNNPTFRFAIDGQSAKAESFSMEIGGDTPNNNFTL